MKLKIKKLIAVAIFGGLLLIAVIIRLNPPEAPQRPAFSGPVMTVETRIVSEQDYPIVLESYGTVQPRTGIPGLCGCGECHLPFGFIERAL